MKTRLLVLPVLLIALIAAGCGGGSKDVPKDAVAVVDGQSIPRSEYDALIAQAKKSYTTQKREFPKAGSAEFQTLRNQAVQFLVQREEFEQQAKDLGIEVTDKQLADRLKQIKTQYFGGDDKKYQAQLKTQGLTDTQVRSDIRAQIISEQLFEKVTKDVKVTDEDIQQYYEKNKSQYSQAESREVRHILVKTRAQANDIVDQLEKGADFSELAKKFSQDTGSKENGGKLTITKGQTVAPFDQTAFLLKTNTISKPVKTEFGYHIIQPIGEIQDAKTQPLKEVKETIRSTLLQTKKNTAMTKWVDDLKKKYEDDVDYATGFTPPAPPATTAATTTG